MLGWCFRSRVTGRFTIVQFPNLALALFVAATIAARFVPRGTAVARTAEWTAVVMLAWWALDELVRGVNPFRRLLGGAALAVTANTAWSLLG